MGAEACREGSQAGPDQQPWLQASLPPTCCIACAAGVLVAAAIAGLAGSGACWSAAAAAAAGTSASPAAAAKGELRCGYGNRTLSVEPARVAAGMGIGLLNLSAATAWWNVPLSAAAAAAVTSRRGEPASEDAARGAGNVTNSNLSEGSTSSTAPVLPAGPGRHWQRKVTPHMLLPGCCTALLSTNLGQTSGMLPGPRAMPTGRPSISHTPSQQVESAGTAAASCPAHGTR